MATTTLLHPSHPERVCWGCDKTCRADDLSCGNDTVRTLHPCELFGDEWIEWVLANGDDVTLRMFGKSTAAHEVQDPSSGARHLNVIT